MLSTVEFLIFYSEFILEFYEVWNTIPHKTPKKYSHTSTIVEVWLYFIQLIMEDLLWNCYETLGVHGSGSCYCRYQSPLYCYLKTRLPLVIIADLLVRCVAFRAPFKEPPE